MKIEYLSLKFVYFIHMVAIDEAFCEYDGHVKYSEELRGIKDINLYKSAVLQPRQSFGGEDLYPDVITKASCYLRSLAMDHPFYDGNKRTALLATVIFLEMNGYKMTCSNEQLYSFTKRVVEEKMEIDKITEELKKYIRISKINKLKNIFRKFNNYLEN